MCVCVSILGTILAVVLQVNVIRLFQFPFSQHHLVIILYIPICNCGLLSLLLFNIIIDVKLN